MQVVDPGGLRGARHNILLYGTLRRCSPPAVVGGFFTYGDTRWATLYTWCRLLWNPARPVLYKDLRFYQYNPASHHIGDMVAPTAIAKPGAYIICDTNAAEVALFFAISRGRARVLTPSNTGPRDDRHYSTRSRLRDNHTCLITHRLETPRRLSTAHIFPRSFDAEWNLKGFASLITDPAPTSTVGGTKIDSVQNIITLQSDLHSAWDAYELGVDIHDNYKVIAFTAGNDDVHGRHLRLDHIEDPNLRPLDALLEDHFHQCILKWMRKPEEETPHKFDDDPFEPYAMDLSDTARWTSETGKHMLEHVLRDRLFETRAAQGLV